MTRNAPKENSVEKFENWLASSPLGSAVKAFIAIVLSMAIADFVSKGTINFASWQTWVIAGLASAVPVVINWLNPADTRYGKTVSK